LRQFGPLPHRIGLGGARRAYPRAYLRAKNTALCSAVRIPYAPPRLPAETRGRCRSGALVQRLAAELDALDAEFVPTGLISDDLGQHPLSLSPSPEELDHLLDLGANDSPDDHAPKTCGGQGSRLLAKSCVPCSSRQGLAGGFLGVG
jgi:hypothetical protein